MAPVPTSVTEALDRLTAATDEFTESVDELKRQQIESAEVIKRRQWWTLILLVVMVLGTLVAGYAAYQIRDCTTPGGQCAERNRQQTGKAIQRLIDANVWIGECNVIAKGDENAYHFCLKGGGLTPPSP
ncbi:MAG TPA: hypothetical protein VIV12_13370 [Streptosporangiaceae bacterium]